MSFFVNGGFLPFLTLLFLDTVPVDGPTFDGITFICIGATAMQYTQHICQ